jgi:RHS repeat-associated protein
LSAVGGSTSKSYSFDLAGHITSDGAATYTYNDAGRMVSATVGSTTTTYAFNALGQRVKKVNGANTTYFVYDEAGRLIGEYDGSGNVVQEIVWFEDIPVAALRPKSGGGGDLFYIHTDHLNTPRKITRPSDNAIVWRWDSDPFGATAANENPTGFGTFTFNLRFAGQYFDPETGLNYNYFRDYDPQTGRYVESDPIGLGGGLNTYAYAESDPVMVNDPLGLDTAVCTRRLRNVPLRFGPFFHQYVCVGNAKTGYTCKGLGPTGSILKSPGKLEDDAYKPRACTTLSGDDKCIEGCIQKRFGEKLPTYSVNLASGENCQTYSNDVLSDCTATCKVKKQRKSR